MGSRVAAGVGAAGVFVAAAVLRFANLGAQSFWYDEAVTLTVIDGSLGDVLDRVPDTESTPPLYYVLAWMWTRATGLSEAGVRSLSAVAGLAAVAVAYWAARELRGHRAGLITAAVMAANPMLVWFSQEARAYSLLSLFAAVSALAVVRALKRPTAFDLALWSAASVLMLVTHYFGLFLVLPEAVLLLVAAGRRRAVLVACVPWGLIGLALVPLARRQEGDGRTAWIDDQPLGRRLGEVLRDLLSANTRIEGALYWLPATVAVLAAIVLVARHARRTRARPSGLLLVAVATIAVPYLLALGPLDFFIHRNLLAAWPLLAVLLGAALAAAVRPPVAAVIAVAIAGAGAAACVRVATDTDLQRANWRDAIARIGGDDVPRAVLIQPTHARAPLAAYGVELTDAAPGVGIRELIVIGTDTAPEAATTSVGPLKVVERYREEGVGLVRYRSDGLERLDASSLQLGGAGLRYMPTASTREWGAAVAGLTVGWRELAATAPEDVAAGAEADAPDRVEALLPVPAELPDPGGLGRRLTAAAAAAAAYGEAPTAAGQERLATALAGLAPP